MFEDGVEVRYGQADKSHENRFFRFFAKSVKAYFDKKGIRACLLGMPTCLVNDRLQIDALLITSKTITIIDFKDYKGHLILPDEGGFRRGPWEMESGLRVKGGSSPNPFYQTGLQRDRLMKILELTCKNFSTFDPHHISIMVCFQRHVAVQGTIPGQYRPYFHIADADTFLENLFDIVNVGREDAGLLEPKFIEYFNRKVFQSADYDLSVTPESLGITLSEEINAASVAAEDSSLVPEEEFASSYEVSVREFFESDAPVLIVTGTVGSGKTSLVPFLRSVAIETGFSSARVFGLSNRVIGNLLSSVDEVESLYSALFDFSATKIAENGEKNVPLAKLVNEAPFSDLENTADDDAKSVFVICEAQMVTDASREDGMLKFGSGRLLSDLLEHLSIREGKESQNKVVFVGDKFLLGFGSWRDSCLNPDWYGGRIAVRELELADTESPNGIQSACLDIANSIRKGITTNVVLEQNDQISICEPQVEAALLKDAAGNWRNHKVLSYTNRQAQGLNGYIKRRIVDDGNRCAIGDVVIFENQIYAYPSKSTDLSVEYVAEFGDQEPRRINTGEFATVTRIGVNPQDRITLSERVPYSDAVVVLTLVSATVRLESSKLGEEYEVYYIEELLESDNPKLDFQQEQALQIHLKSLFDAAIVSNPFESSPYYAEMIEKGDFQYNKDGKPRDKGDARYLTVYEKRHREEVQRGLLSGGTEYSKWLNAAQLRYGWCMTVHKAMSYSFNKVTFSPKTDGGRTNEGYLRFLYTGISRAREHVNLVRWTPISPFEKTEYGHAESGVGASKKKPAILSSTPQNVVQDIRDFVEGVLPTGASIKSTKSSSYQEIYEIGRDDVLSKLVFDYGGDARVKMPRLATGDKCLFADIRASIESSTPQATQAEGSGLEWLYAYLRNKVLPDYDIRIQSSSAYRDVVQLVHGGRSLIVRVDYKKSGSVSGFKLVSGDGEAYKDVMDAIKSYYHLMDETA